MNSGGIRVILLSICEHDCDFERDCERDCDCLDCDGLDCDCRDIDLGDGDCESPRVVMTVEVEASGMYTLTALASSLLTDDPDAD